MTTSQAGRRFIEAAEGVRLSAYLDGRGIPTIGFGHTLGVKMGDVCTWNQADQWLSEDLQVAEHVVNTLVTAPLTQNQFDALVSLEFNIGAANFKTSTLLRLINGGSVQAAADAFLTWNHVDGKVSQGLENRRKAERQMFLWAQSSQKA